MIENLKKRWWLIALRGLLTILFGIAAIFSPAVVIFSLLTVFSFFAVLAGVFIITLAFLAEITNKWLRIVEGLIFIATGFLVIFNQTAAVSLVMIVIAVWAVISGIMDIIIALRLRNVLVNEWFMIFNGILSVLFGIIIASNLLESALSLTVIFGIFALISGVVLIIHSVRIKNLKLH